MRSIRKLGTAPFIWGALLVLSVSVLVALGITNLASAAIKQSDMSLEEKNKSSSYYITLQGCIQNNMWPTIKASSANYAPTSVSWFDDNNAYGFVYPSGQRDCKDVMQAALGIWNISPDDFLAGIKYKKAGANSYNWDGTGDGATRRANYESFIKSQLGTTDPGNPGAAAAYLRYDYWWDNQCVAKKFGDYSKITDQVTKSRIDSGYTEVTNLSVMSAGETAVTTSITVKYIAVERTNGVKWGYSYKYSNDTTAGITSTSNPYSFTAYGYHTNPRKVKCTDVAASLTQYAGDYDTYLTDKAVEDLCRSQGYITMSSSSTNPFGIYTLSACVAGYKNQSNPVFCATNYVPQTINYGGKQLTNNKTAELEACKFGFGLTGDDIAAARDGIISEETTKLENGNDAETQSCGGIVSGIGWFLCPVLNAMAGLNDAMWGFASGLLNVSPVQQTDSSGYKTPTYQIWEAFRSIANVMLIIVFLVMIFSQLSGSGISNYGIKKTLPRLIVAAIAINTSFFIMQLAVDAFNIAGKGIYDLMDSLIQIPQPKWEDLIGLIIGLGTAGTAAVLTVTMAPQYALMLIVPPALAALIAVLVAVMTLLFRQALIPILIVLAPLAFVAYLLPNTKSWYDKWQKMFIAMLMLFPLAAVLFAGVKLAAAVIQGSGGIWGTLGALVILTVPLFMLPFIARQAGPALGKLNSAMKGLGNKVQKPVGDWAGRRKALSLAKSDASPAGRFNYLKRARQGLSNSRRKTELNTAAYKAEGEAAFTSVLAANANDWAGNVKGSAAQAHIRAVATRAQAEEVKLEMDSMRHDGSNLSDRKDLAAKLKIAIKNGEQSKATALTNFLVQARGLDELHGALTESEADGHLTGDMRTTMKRAMLSPENGGLVKERRADLMKWGTSNDVKTDSNGAPVLDASGQPVQNTVSSITGEASTWNLSPEDAAGLTETALKEAQATGGFSAASAARLLKTPALAAKLDDNKRAIVEQIAGGASSGAQAGAAAAAGGGAAPAAQSGSGGGDPTVLVVDRGGQTAAPVAIAPPQNAQQSQQQAKAQALQNARAAQKPPTSPPTSPPTNPPAGGGTT
ncbi:MAG: hypothetical protein WAQ27_05010 [Candidatus Microsaccharimonas sp.]